MTETVFTPEQEARIAEIVRAVIREEKQATVERLIDEVGQRLQAPRKTLTAHEGDRSAFAWPPQRVAIIGSEIILDAPRITVKGVIQSEPQQSS